MKEKDQLTLFEMRSFYDEHWVDMPEFKNDALAVKSVHVHFKTEKDFSDFSVKLGISIKSYSIWYVAK